MRPPVGPDATSPLAPVLFGDDAVALFRRLSHDLNPLHADGAYARRTPFGAPVVHGMLGVLAALRPVTRSGPVRLRALRAKFLGPLFTSTSYDLGFDASTKGDARIQLGAGGSAKVELRLRHELSTPHAPPMAMPQGWRPQPAPLDPSVAELGGLRHEGSYAIDPGAAAELDGALGIGLENLPASQLQALAWISYSCGMLVPGRQSLIGDIELAFADGDAGPGPLGFQVEVGQHSTVGMMRLKARLQAGGRPVADVTINALRRPDPVAFSLEALLEHASRGEALRGQVALVTGGSRGLGAYLVGALCLQGADVWLNYRTGAEEAEQLRAALVGTGGAVRVVQGDVTDAAACQRLAAEVVAAGGIDVLIANASPPIRAATLAEQGADALERFVAGSLRACLLPTAALLPSLRKSRGCVVAVSSRYAATAPARFAHYVAAKGAIEGLVTSLAREEKSVRFALARPPKLLTDQTNINFDFEQRLHPARAAARIVEHLLQPASAGEVSMLDRF